MIVYKGGPQPISPNPTPALKRAEVRPICPAGRARWLALIAWQSAVLQYQRLHLIANNSHFVILPEARCRNLASRVLALNLKRLSADWQCVYGHTLLLAKTFIDTARFHGGCYRAANRRFLGATRGYARRPGGGYTHHGQPKAVAVYPLARHARRSSSWIVWE